MKSEENIFMELVLRYFNQCIFNKKSIAQHHLKERERRGGGGERDIRVKIKYSHTSRNSFILLAMRKYRTFPLLYSDCIWKGEIGIPFTHMYILD